MNHPLAKIAERISAGHQCFAELAFELFADYGADFSYDRMNEKDRRLLCAAYMREHPEIVDDVLAGKDMHTIAEHVADLIERPTLADALDNCDAIDLAGELWGIAFPDISLTTMVEGKLDHQWHVYESARDERAETDKAEVAQAYGG